MKLVLFAGITTLDEAKQLYKTLAKKHHPDKGGDVEIMKMVNREYELICARLIHKMDKSQEEKDREFDLSQIYKEKIDGLIDIEGIIIELTGTWLWVTGKTYGYNERFKEMKFFWAPMKKAWFWKPEDQKSSNRKEMTLDQIRSKYGTTLLFGDKLISLQK